MWTGFFQTRLSHETKSHMKSNKSSFHESETPEWFVLTSKSFPFKVFTTWSKGSQWFLYVDLAWKRDYYKKNGKPYIAFDFKWCDVIDAVIKLRLIYNE